LWRFLAPKVIICYHGADFLQGFFLGGLHLWIIWGVYYFLNVFFGVFLLSFLSFLLPLDDNRKSAKKLTKKIMQRLFERFFLYLHQYALCTFFAKF
jgi:hypothetical protein